MKKYIALFRGINVGGKNILPMKELVGILDGMGYKNIRTYIQSGNVIFQAAKGARNKISKAIAAAILARHGFEAKVLLLEPADLQAAIDNNPFPTDDGKALHFFFLDESPGKPDFGQLTAIKSKSEKFELNNRVFYLYAPDGIGRSKLATGVEKYLGVPTTARNWNTVAKLMTMITQA